MARSSSRSRAEQETFARSLNRASARRGALDVVYKELSEHWTLLMQQLYPVWLVIGPGLSNPGHIELSSRTVYLDSEELLGSQEEILAGSLDRYRVLACFGVAFHETMHAKHTKRWVPERLKRLEQEGQRTLAHDLLLLEEPRMEAHGVRDYPHSSARGRFIRRALSAAVVSVILPRFEAEMLGAAAAGQRLSREVCGRAMSYLAARTHYGILDSAMLGALTPIWEGVLGAGDVRALHELYARVIWVPDGQSAAIDACAAEYRAIIGPPVKERARGACAGEGARGGIGRSGGPERAGGQDGADAPNGPAGTREPRQGQGMKSLAEALREALQQAQCAQQQQLSEEVSLREVLARAAGKPKRLAHVSGTGSPSGRMPDRGINRPPFADEAEAAIRFAKGLEAARSLAVRRIAKRTPGGRFSAREHIRAMAQRGNGRPITAQPWSLERQVRGPLREPHVGLIVDTSGSMAAYEYALGPIVWIIDSALRMVGGRLASALFGNGVSLLSDGCAPLSQVPGIRTGGGTAFAGDAVLMCCEHLEMEDRRRPRLLFIISDGGWYDTAAGVEKIQWLAEIGVPTIHIAIGCEPLSVQAARISVIADPADALQILAADTVAALRGAAPAR